MRFPRVALKPITVLHNSVLARLHATCFAKPWSREAFGRLLDSPGVCGWLENTGRPKGFILVRHGAGEGEILTLAVRPNHRRKGIGTSLLKAVLAEFSRTGIRLCHLEVARDN